MKNILMITTIFLIVLGFSGCQNLEQECKEERVILMKQLSNNDVLGDKILLYEKKCKEKLSFPTGDLKANPSDDTDFLKNTKRH